MPTLIHQRVRQAQENKNPFVICRMSSGWAVMGDHQALLGYALLLPDPVVPDLNALKGDLRSQYLDDVVRLGDAVLEATGCVRINYEILGNLEPALHTHIFPRYVDEPEELRTKPVWFYDLDNAPAFDVEHPDHVRVRNQIRDALSMM